MYRVPCIIIKYYKHVCKELDTLYSVHVHIACMPMILLDKV